MIHANELMIGNWVVWATLPTKIDAIAEGGFSVHLKDEGWQSVDAVEPIKLTPEILEKNGFEFGHTAREEDFCSVVGCGYPEEKGWCYDEGAGEIKIVFPNDTDGGLVMLDDECGNRHIEFNYAEPIMVHDLQHALRLCGIEKEIEL